MTISTTESRVEYQGNGVSTLFAIPFRFLENAHIFVTLVGTDGTQAPQSQGANYTLTGADEDDGGTLTMLVAPPAGAYLVVVRVVPATQETDYISGDPFPAESHERALDKLTMLVQQGIEADSRTLKFPVGDLASQIGELPPAALRADRLLSFDSMGRPIAIAPSDQSATSLALALAQPGGSNGIGFIQAGTGAVARTSQSKMRERVSVWDFGAIGDGAYHPLSERFGALETAQLAYPFATSLSDSIDWAALQAGINYTAGRFTLDVSSGTFIVNRRVTMISGTLIDGNGVVKLMDNCLPRLGQMVFCNTATDVHMFGITIDENRENNVDHGTPDGSGNQPGNWQGTLLTVIDYAYVSNFSINGVTVRNSWGSGIWLTDCFDGEVDGSTIIDYRITGIALRNNTADVRNVSNIRVRGNRVEGGIVGIHAIFGARDLVISGNDCNNNRDRNRFPAYAYSGTYPNVWPSTGGFTAFGQPGYVSPAFIGDGAGIEATGSFTDPGGTSNFSITISSNTCSQNAVGVRLEETSTKFSVSGNVCRQNDAYGILLFSAYFNTITGNVCSQNLLDGIRLEKTAGKPQASNNIISANVCTENSRFGVIIVGSGGCIIQGNHLSGNGANVALAESGAIGLYLADGIAVTGCIIQGNNLSNFFGTDKYGIYSGSASNVANLIIGNFFTGSYVTSAVANLSPSLNKFTRNIGYQTEGFGAATVLAGATFVDVAHGMAYTPDLNSVRVSPIGDTLGGRWWVQTVTPTTIRVQMNSAPASNVSFGWSVAP